MREPFTPQLNADEYLRWETRQSERFELHHGFVVAFAGGTIDHGRIGLNMQIVLDRLFPAPWQTFGPDVKVRVSAAGFYYADAGVACQNVDPQASFVASPRVIAEVLSPSTRTYDLVDKRAAYRAVASLELYAIVHTTMRRVEIDSRNVDATWSTAVFDYGDAYFGDRALSLDDVYERSSLANTRS